MYKLLKYFFSIASIILIGVVIYFSFFNIPSMNLDLPGKDKTGHFLAYLAFSFCSSISLFLIKKRKRAFFIMLPLSIILGITIEFIQPSFGRSFEIADMFADIFGSALGIMLSALFLRISLRVNLFSKTNMVDKSSPIN